MLHNGDVHFFFVFVVYLFSACCCCCFFFGGVQAGVIGVGLMLIMSLLACCAVLTNEAFVCKLFYNRNF